MAGLRCLCHIGLHRWRSESEAKRYRHNTYWNKTQNRLDPAKPLIKFCTRCGTKRIWSFNRGKWRHYEVREKVDTSRAWQVDPPQEKVEGDATLPVVEALAPPVKTQA